MEKLLNHARQLAGKNAALMQSAKSSDAAIRSAANTHLIQVTKQLESIPEHQAIVDPDQSALYLDLVHRKASLERLLAGDGSALTSRDGRM